MRDTSRRTEVWCRRGVFGSNDDEPPVARNWDGRSSPLHRTLPKMRAPIGEAKWFFCSRNWAAFGYRTIPPKRMESREKNLPKNVK
jgi:hypothetical protein